MTPMRVEGYNVDPRAAYDGPEFEEYCISEGKYLPAARDRSPCIPCPLNTLCQPGFEEQVRRIAQGKNPSLTEGCSIPPDRLTPEQLLEGLTPEQRAFVIAKVPGLSTVEMRND
jgi:hypothetical protein